MSEKNIVHQTDDHAYIICDHRRNAPRISVKVCEQSCKIKDQCVEYKLYCALRQKNSPAEIAAAEQGLVC